MVCHSPHMPGCLFNAAGYFNTLISGLYEHGGVRNTTYRDLAHHIMGELRCGCTAWAEQPTWNAISFIRLSGGVAWLCS